MKIRDTLSYSFGAIRLRKLRSGLTTLGIVIGIAAIVALLSFTEGFQVAITGQFQEGFSTDTVTVQPNSGGFFRLPGGADSDFELYQNDTQLINDVDGVEISAATISKMCTVEFDDFELTLSISGVDYLDYRELYSSFSVEFGAIPEEPSNDTAIVGARIHDPWDNGTIAVDVGDTLNIFYSVRNGTSLVPVNKSITVVGVLEEIGSIAMGPIDSGVYIPIDAAIEYFDSEVVDSIAVKLESDDSEFIDMVSEQIEELYANEVVVQSPTAFLESLETMLATVEVLLAGIAGISLLVAGIGIMNIMIVSLMERTREIGILKALGAKSRTVLGVFLSEAVLIGVIGGIFGIVTGAILANVFSSGMGGLGGIGPGMAASGTGISISPVLTPTLAVEALLFGIIVSVVFALYPAWRASKLAPVDALRHE